MVDIFADISKSTSMTIEDVYNTLCIQGLIDVLAVPTPKPLPGQSIKLVKNRKSMVARRHLIRSQTNDDDVTKGSFVPPTQYVIHWDPGYVKSYLEKWEEKGYMKIKPEKLKWSPFLLVRVKKSDADAGLALEAEMIGDTSEKENPGPASASSVPETPAPITPTDGEDSNDETISAPVPRSPEKRMDSSEQSALRRLRSQNRTPKDNLGSNSPFTPSRYLRGPGISGSPPNAMPTPSRASSASASPSKPPRAPKPRERGSSSIKNVDSSVKEDQSSTSVYDGVDEDADAALAARLAEEESRPKRLLRSRSGTGTLPTFEFPLFSSRTAMTRPPPRKRRRVESPIADDLSPAPEPLRDSGSINGVTRGDMEVQSEPDDAGTPVTVVTSRHSAPSDDTVVAAITTIPDVTESIKEDTTSSHVVTVTDPQAMDVDKAPLAETVIVNVNLGADADADGETDADAEGEDDDELDAEGEPDDEL
jgi:hypothetical protein